MLCFKSLPLLAAYASALSSAEWRSQSIYQLVTDRFATTTGSTPNACNLGSYCGGTFRGIITQLDYIQGMVFTAIWISPVVENLNTTTPYGLPYHGYWAQDIYSINPNFGTPADLKDLATALHARGMYLMVDVVTNHMGFNGDHSQVKYDLYHPFNEQAYYHPYCGVDYNNMTSCQECWAGDDKVSLPDLRTEDREVQSMWNSWVKSFVKNYTIDGLRIDSAMEVDQAFFPSFVDSAGVYAVGEVFNGNPDLLCTYQDYMPGVLNYAYYFWIKRAFPSDSATMTEMAAGIANMRSKCKDTTLLGNFIENHDNPRILSDGIPIVYYGQEQGFAGVADPENRQPLWPSHYNTSTELYGLITRLNALRNSVTAHDKTYATTPGKIVYAGTKLIATQKGAVGTGLIALFNNHGGGGTASVVLGETSTGFAAYESYMDVVECTTYTTDEYGTLSITVSNGMPMALINTKNLDRTGLCKSVPSLSSLARMSSTTSVRSSSTQCTSTTMSSSADGKTTLSSSPSKTTLATIHSSSKST